MEKRIIELYRRKFDDIRHEEDGIEYWYARELMTLLDYVQWRNFENVVKKGMLSCKNNGIRVEDHFAGVSKMVHHWEVEPIEKLRIICLPVMHVILLLKMEIHERSR